MANVSAFTGAMPVIPGGLVELGYSQITSNVTVSATGTGTSATSVIPAMTVVCDGSAVSVEFFAAQVGNGSGANIYISLLRDGAELVRYWGVWNGSSAQVPMHLQYRDTPTAGSHTYEVRAFRATANGTVFADTGTANASPAFLRVSKIVNQNDGLKPFWTPPVVTSLPSQATVGDQVIYAADATNGVYWNLYYDGIGTYPWKFVGGAPLRSSNGTYPAGQNNSSYTDITSGATVVAPLAGDYMVFHAGRTDSTNPTVSALIEICAATASIASSGQQAAAVGFHANVTGVVRGAWSYTQKLSAVIANETIKLQQVTGVGSFSTVFFYTRLDVTPIRVKAP